MTYPERMKYLGLPTLDYRRVRADLKETYKILHGITDISPHEFFAPERYQNTIGHAHKLDTHDVTPSNASRHSATEWSMTGTPCQQM